MLYILLLLFWFCGIFMPHPSTPCTLFQVSPLHPSSSLLDSSPPFPLFLFSNGQVSKSVAEHIAQNLLDYCSCGIFRLCKPLSTLRKEGGDSEKHCAPLGLNRSASRESLYKLGGERVNNSHAHGKGVVPSKHGILWFQQKLGVGRNNPIQHLIQCISEPRNTLKND